MLHQQTFVHKKKHLLQPLNDKTQKRNIITIQTMLRIALIIITCLLTFTGFSENQADFSFRQIAALSELTAEAINSVEQDSLGYIWVGTNRGLFRYDSERFEAFTADASDPKSLSHNVVTDILITSENQLWISTRIGLSVFNRNDQSFSRVYYHDSDGSENSGNVSLMKQDATGNFWIIDEKGLGILDPTTRIISRIELNNGEDMPTTLSVNKNENIWIGSNRGNIYRVHNKTLEIQKYEINSGIGINSLAVENNTLYIGNGSTGLSVFSIHPDGLKPLSLQKHATALTETTDVRTIVKDSSGRLWIGTYNGLFIKGKNNKFTKIQDNTINPSVYCIMEDREKGIWVGTWLGGIFYYHPDNNEFKTYRKNLSNGSLSNNVVSCFAETSSGQIFIGTEAGGLNQFNKETETFKKINIYQEKPNLNIKDQCFDKRGGHWIATNRDGLFYKAPEKSGYHHFTEGEETGYHVSHRNIYALAPADSGVWIGTHGGGVNFFDFKTKKISFEASLFNGRIKLSNPYIRNMCLDSHGYLWTGTVNGLNRTNLHTGENQILTYGFDGNVRNDYINSITQITEDEIWIGTRMAGINVFSYETNSFRKFNVNGFLNKKDVYGVYKDEDDNLWITTNNGLLLHNLETKHNRVFNKEDGLQGNWFCANAIIRSKNGRLYFGGTNGFSSIDPVHLAYNNRPPVVSINQITINNKTTKSLNIKSSNKTQTIKLKPNQRTLYFEFSSDNYLIPQKNKYMYRLTNHYDQWLEVTGKAEIMFPNLDWGEYTFEVKSCNNDGVWSVQPARLKVIIPKPLYATTAAFTFYFIIILGLFLFILTIIKNRIKLQHQVMEERRHLNQIEAVNEMKIEFFTNISHEFRTPLSLIMGPLKNLLNEPNINEEQKRSLNIISRNASRLLSLINQILDLRKLERGKEKLSLIEFDLISFVKERVINFEEEAARKKIQFDFIHPEKSFTVEADIEKLDFIINNLLSNAFKFTNKKGKIEVKIESTPYISENEYDNQTEFGTLNSNEVFNIQITDTGLGIDQNDINAIFNRFVQGKNLVKDSSGIGLSVCRDYVLLHYGKISLQSTPQKGSEFNVILPIRQMAETSGSEAEMGTATKDEKISSLKPKITLPKPQFEKTVLLVEDNNDLRDYLNTVLEKFFTVKTASNGKDGLNLLTQMQIDLVISDVMMPEMDGFELCQNIKSSVSISHIPVILLTALSSTDNRVTGINTGADAYITKPFEETELISQVNNLLQQRALLRKHYANSLFVPNDESTDLDNYFLSKINRIIDENLNNEDLNVDNFIKEIGISRSQLHRKLKSLTNYSTTEYIRNYRLEKALELMKSGEYTINEISFMVGFNTHTYFSRCFKKHFNKTPKEALMGIRNSQKQ